MLQRFEKYVELDYDGCWLWLGGNRHGSGRFWFEGRYWKASRFSYELFVGPITNGLQALHYCDNQMCVNPEHLFLGTHDDNMRDMVSKGREAHILGEDHGRSRLTWKDVEEIRALYSSGNTSYRKLSVMFDVVKSRIGSIVRKTTWTKRPLRTSI